MTVEYFELSREELLPGVRIQARFEDTSTNVQYTKSFIVDGTLPSEASIDLKIESMKEDIIFSTNPMNYYELDGEDVQPILHFMVITVRGDPDIILVDLVDAVDIEYPDAFWNINRLIAHMRHYLHSEIGTPYTYDEFKVFMIDNKFKGLD